MPTDVVRILEGNTFVVCDERGDIEASSVDPTGLFSYDTRFLSTWTLTVDGERLNALSTDDLQYYEAQFFLVPGTGTVYANADLSVIRRRTVGSGFVEQLTILNHKKQPVDLEVRLTAGCDFADLFEVKDALTKQGTYHHRIEDRGLVLGYERETFRRETVISSTTPVSVDKGGLTFSVRVEPHGSWQTEIHVVVALGVVATPESATRGRTVARTRLDMARGLDKWLTRAPRLICDWESLVSTYRRSLVDLAALRFT